jgi:hypothetical protein
MLINKISKTLHELFKKNLHENMEDPNVQEVYLFKSYAVHEWDCMAQTLTRQGHVPMHEAKASTHGRRNFAARMYTCRHSFI